jgi:hypothetical protein
MSDELARPVMFDPGLVTGLLGHLNRCHPQENLVLARLAHDQLRDEAGYAGDTAAPVTRALVAGLDGHGVDLLGETKAGPIVLRLSFGWPARTLAAVGEELRLIYRTACR